MFSLDCPNKERLYDLYKDISENHISKRIKKCNYENEITTLFNGLIKDYGGFVYKISDESRGKKPYDDIICLGGNTFHTEIKYIKEKKRTELMRHLEPNQISALTKVRENGGVPLIVVFHRHSSTFFFIEFHGEMEIDLDFESGKIIRHLASYKTTT